MHKLKLRGFVEFGRRELDFSTNARFWLNRTVEIVCERAQMEFGKKGEHNCGWIHL